MVGFCTNLIMRHPKTLRLIHRRSTSKAMDLKLKTDPYREDESDPMETRALRSSLWELDTLMRQHLESGVR